VSRFQFVADNSDHFAARGGVKRLCEVLEVERSSFYAWLKAAPARVARAAADAALAARIRAIHATDNTMGAPRMTAELNDQLATEEALRGLEGVDELDEVEALLGRVLGATPVHDAPDDDGLDDAPDDAGLDDAGLDEPRAGGPQGRVNHKRVARVMREHGIVGYRRRRRVRTTIPEPSDQKVPDLLERDFTAEAPNTRYVGDITYLPLADGSNLYLATVIDCFSRSLVGWAVADHMRTSLVEDALKAAASTRGGRGALAGAIFHSDHGSVYTSKDYAALCRRLGVTQSMGAVGSSADNALAESFNATLKREVLQDAACWADEATCRRQVFRWLVRYNLHRRHTHCRYLSPSTYEAHWAATLPTAA
jgi:transposase InsO family protein